MVSNDSHWRQVAQDQCVPTLSGFPGRSACRLMNANIGHSKITGHAQSKFIFRFQAEHLTPSSSAFPSAPPLRRDIVKVAGENTRQSWLCSSGNRTVIPSVGQSVCNTQYLPRIPWRLQIGFARSKLMGRQNKIDAKRRNASKSTGPKTPEEKTAISLNSLRPRRAKLSAASWMPYASAVRAIELYSTQRHSL